MSEVKNAAPLTRAEALEEENRHEVRELVAPRVSNPFGKLTEQTRGGLIAVEQQRAIAEVQARMIVARANPRDPVRAMDLILQDCTRVGLAESAMYAYSRGGTDISGPSIRLMETCARRWGNIASGIKEISRRGDYSECVAYAWDLESGYYDERQFQVRHWRDTRGGGYLLKDERDIYELIANFGQRRKRAVLIAVIPGDVVEAATAQCEATLKADVQTDSNALKRLADAFAELGVNKAHIEKRCQCHLEAIRPAQIVQLRKIYASIRDGMSMATDWFEITPEMVEAKKTEAPRQQQPQQNPAAGTPPASKARSQPQAEAPVAGPGPAPTAPMPNGADERGGADLFTE